ncbi:DUF134 domain-containing protein [Formosa sp. PL04]|uniref:DUF134 domain-containing protein n=1 Tax=Formosa sp. PL04 TaxID=3081755 RepID=UPI00298208EA|nr:DUF134 domain-containing protein [Formosa sp. PL04]MDW5289638.1 DUF134 domain-containing protein [Formosa sp. PL04]
MNARSLYLCKVQEMSRPIKKRKVNAPPQMVGFKPFGIAFCEAEQVAMQYEEYETIKLVIYDDLSQEIAADKMEISRPTLTRIYNSALKKIGQAFVEGKSIIIEGGDFEFDKDWYKCKRCFKLITGDKNCIKCGDCPSSNEDELINLNK